MALINSKLFDLPIYKHKQLGIIIIIFLFFIYYIYRYIKEDYPQIYLSFPILIPSAIAFYLLIILLKAYSFCKIKFICDNKYILPSIILILYNLFGSLLCFIASIIPHFYPCTETHVIDDEDNFFSIVCKVKENEEYNMTEINIIEINMTEILYYDNYSIYFKIFSKKIF